jgi:hypothetical protein
MLSDFESRISESLPRAFHLCRRRTGLLKQIINSGGNESLASTVTAFRVKKLVVTDTETTTGSPNSFVLTSVGSGPIIIVTRAPSLNNEQNQTTCLRIENGIVLVLVFVLNSRHYHIQTAAETKTHTQKHFLYFLLFDEVRFVLEIDTIDGLALIVEIPLD